MKTRLASPAAWLALALSFPLLLLSSACCRADRNLNKPGYNLTWHDDFDGTNLNAKKWNVRTGYNNANGELEDYGTPNVYVTNGTLVLESDKVVSGGTTTYTSGDVTSAGKFDQKYGYFEWRGQIPWGQGIWPAYWMLRADGVWPPEIDVMETIGTAVYCNTMSLHWGPLPAGCVAPEDCGHTENTRYCGAADFSAGFHTYAVDWETWGAAFYIDGVQQYYASWLGNCTNNMYLIMNTAVGGNFPGSPDGTTPFPSYNRIDYVHVFQPVSAPYVLLNPGFESGEATNDFDNWNSYESGNVFADPASGSAHGGSRAVLMTGRTNGQDNTSGIFQDLWAAPGDHWVASIWGRNNPKNLIQGGNQGRLKLEFVDGNDNVIISNVRTNLTAGSSTNYAQFTLAAIAPAGTARARIVAEYFQTGDAAGAVDFDDAALIDTPNVLTDPSVEAGSGSLTTTTIPGWTLYGATWGDYQIINTAFNGTNAFKVYGAFTGGYGYSGIYQDNPAAPAAIYSADGWGYTLSTDQIGAGNLAWIEVSFRDLTGTNILALYRSAGIDTNTPVNTWVDLAVTNQYDPGSYTITNTTASLVAPPGTEIVRYQVVFQQPPTAPGQTNQAQGSVYFDSFNLTQLSGPTRPTINLVSPAGSGVFANPTTGFSFKAASTTTTIPDAGVQLLLNGIDVTTLLSANGPVTNRSINFIQLVPNQVYTAVINVTDAAGNSVTLTTNFDTFSQTNFMWEAEDFDFGGGHYLDSPAPTSAAAANSYFNRLSTPGLDEDYVTYDGTHLYRTNDDIATEVTSDVARQKYLTAQLTDANVRDYDVGWWYAGSWINYTRTFPTNLYRIYGRFAGGAGAYSVQLGMVTSGIGTSNQVIKTLGTFSATGQSWQAWDWVPLLDTNGQPVAVSLGGVSTLRATTAGNANANFYLLLPTTSPPSLAASANGSQSSISFPTQPGFTYMLVYKDSLGDANWKLLTLITGDGTLQSFGDSSGGAKRFYRLIVE